jgi:hypothetical protein
MNRVTAASGAAPDREPPAADDGAFAALNPEPGCDASNPRNVEFDDPPAVDDAGSPFEETP